MSRKRLNSLTIVEMPAVHNIPPLFDEHCRVLVLGSFPSVKSREGMFFYNHPQNRFWKVMAAVLKSPVPETVEKKRLMLLHNHVAVWDVIASCELEGSDDSSIRDVIVNDLRIITEAAPISRVFTNGGTAHRLYRRLCAGLTGLEASCLPSTSPANAKYTLERLIEEWEVIADILHL